MSRTINSPLSKSLGTFIQWKKENNVVLGQTTYGSFRVEFYTEGIARISATQADMFEDFSYAVVATPSYEPHVEEDADKLEIKTSKYILRITKSPVRFGFYTHDGQPINEDDHALVLSAGITNNEGPNIY